MKVYNKKNSPVYFHTMYNGNFITSDCISLLERTKAGTWQLTLFDNCNVIFEKQYKTMAAGKTALTKLINGKYRYIFNDKH